eukprot:4498215-Pyramimonas_sp.AAC.1
MSSNAFGDRGEVLGRGEGRQSGKDRDVVARRASLKTTNDTTADIVAPKIGLRQRSIYPIETSRVPNDAPANLPPRVRLLMHL